MKVCELCGFETDNGKVMSNHKRWKHLGVTFSEEALAKFKAPKKRRYVHNVVCKKCGALGVITTTKEVYEKNWYCSKECSHSREFSSESREKKSQSAKQYRIKHGLNVIEDKECPICGTVYRSKAKTCSTICGHKLRYICDLSKKKDYKLACKFKFSLRDYPEEFNWNLIKEYGWYKATNRGGNGQGVSRDHMLSVDYGWKNGIDPEIIRHPANCNLMLQSENFLKKEGCSITLEELLIKIEKWNSKYGRVF